MLSSIADHFSCLPFGLSSAQLVFKIHYKASPSPTVYEKGILMHLIAYIDNILVLMNGTRVPEVHHQQKVANLCLKPA